MCLTNSRKFTPEQDIKVYKFLVTGKMWGGEYILSPYNSWNAWYEGKMETIEKGHDVREAEGMHGVFLVNGGFYHAYEDVKDALWAAKRYHYLHGVPKDARICIAEMTIPKKGAIVYKGLDNQSSMVSYASTKMRMDKITVEDIRDVFDYLLERN